MKAENPQWRRGERRSQCEAPRPDMTWSLAGVLLEIKKPTGMMTGLKGDWQIFHFSNDRREAAVQCGDCSL